MKNKILLLVPLIAFLSHTLYITNWKVQYFNFFLNWNLWKVEKFFSEFDAKFYSILAFLAFDGCSFIFHFDADQTTLFMVIGGKESVYGSFLSLN